MNLFRLIGDLSHLLAILLLLAKIWKSRSCAGELVPYHAGCALIEVISGVISVKLNERVCSDP